METYKLFTILLVVLLIPLSGCSSESVTEAEVSWAESVCENNDGIKTVSPGNYYNWAKAQCKNGAIFYKNMNGKSN